MNARKVQLSDAPAIQAALVQRMQACGKGTASRVDVAGVPEFITKGANAWILDEQVLIWLEPMANAAGHTGKPLLGENLLIRIAPGKLSFSDIVAFMEGEARRLGCSGIIVATGLSDKDVTMAKVYQRLGFQPESFVLFKEVQS